MALKGNENYANHAEVVSYTDGVYNVGFGAPTKALIIGTSGDLQVKTAGGDEVTIPSVPAGILALRVIRIVEAGTTADNITALF